MKPLFTALAVVTGCAAPPLTPTANVLEGTTVHLEHGGSVDLRTTSVRRGSSELSNVNVGGEQPTSRHRLLVPRERFVESFEPGDEGYEQSWTFPARPTGEGDLVVEVELIGAQLDSADDRGVILSSKEQQIVYTHGVWIDAVGKRSTVPVRFDTARRRLRMVIANDEVLRAKFPAVLDPQIIITPAAHADGTQADR